MIEIVYYQYKGTSEEVMTVPKHVALFNFILRKSLKGRQNEIKLVVK